MEYKEFLMNKVVRDLGKEVLEMASVYPVVTIMGPRQSGKTTLAKMLFPQKGYVTMESPDERDFAKADPKEFLSRFKNGMIIDEIQRAPWLLSYIQEIVDDTPDKGLFILTGSHQIELHDAIAQSLAGRTAILKLLPFSLNEIKSIAPKSLFQNWLMKFFPNFLKREVKGDSYLSYLFNGFYPRVHMDGIAATKFYRNYVATYIEKDVRQMVNVKDLKVFQVFLKLCAGRIGQIFNSQSMANEVGVSHSTIKSWLGILEASFIIMPLIPYYENFGKRTIKSPKIYFTDVGLASYLLEITSIEQLFRDPLRGNLFENFVIMELIKDRFNQGKDANFYFYRDSNQTEVDCLYKKGEEFVLIEIKSAQTFDKSFLKNIKKVMQLPNVLVKKGFLIYAGEKEQDMGDIKILNFNHLTQVF
jgi:predicted AAA+ superfamily ATPase